MDNAAYWGNISDEMGVMRSRWNVVFLLDTSNSMALESGGHRRIDQLNAVMPMVLRALRDRAAEKEVELFVRIIAFNSLASWIMGSAERGIPVEDACNNWKDLSTEGGTDTAAAIRLACTAMHTKYLGTRNYHPVVILVTDGNSDNRTDTQKAIEELRNAMSGDNPNKRDKVWRFAIGVEVYNETELKDFAMTGTMEDEFGNELPNEPMIFRMDKATEIAKAMNAVEDDDYEGDPPEDRDECPIICL